MTVKDMYYIMTNFVVYRPLGHLQVLLVHEMTEVAKVRFQVLTAPSMKMAVFWDVVPCIIALIMGAIRTTGMSVNLYQPAWRNIPKYSYVQVRFRWDGYAALMDKK
jgi:hypothetical protein